jgi:hypothetical protein
MGDNQNDTHRKKTNADHIEVHVIFETIYKQLARALSEQVGMRSITSQQN